MPVRRIIIDVNPCKRVIVYPQGGMEDEEYVDGPGWVLRCPDTEFPPLIPHYERAIADLEACIAAIRKDM